MVVGWAPRWTGQTGRTTFLTLGDVSTTKTPDKASIKERIKQAITKATAGLTKEQAAQLAFSIAATAVPGARLLKRRHWSIH
ncbi:MAG: hypothetical protein ACK55D_15240 [Synechococcaceae cyanobacterium]